MRSRIFFFFALLTIALGAVGVSALNTTTAATTGAPAAPTPAPTPPPPAPSANGRQLFTVRSLPFNNGNNAMTFQDQLAAVQRQIPKIIQNKTAVTLAYNQSSQGQQCWADVQECAQTLTWWFTTSDNEALFLATGNTDEVNAQLLGVEVFRKGATVPDRVLEVPSIAPFLTKLFAVYGVCSVGSIICMLVAWKIADR